MRVIKSRRMRWAGNVARMGEEYKLFRASLYNLLLSPVTSSLLGTNIIFNTMFSNTHTPKCMYVCMYMCLCVCIYIYIYIYIYKPRARGLEQQDAQFPTCDLAQRVEALHSHENRGREA